MTPEPYHGHDSADAENGAGDDERATVDRRRLLTAVGGALAAGLAGCSEVTSQEFAASPVRLPEPVGEELGLAEVFTDSRTTTRQRSVGGRDVEVAITSRFAGYGRTGISTGLWDDTRLTLVERFAGIGREATPGSGSAINAVASDLGVEAANPEFVEGDTPVSGDRITFVIPERARHDGEVRLTEVLALHHADALPVDELTSRGGNNYLVEAPGVIPDREFVPAKEDGYTPDERWVAGHEGHWLPDDPSQLRCLVCLGEQSPAEVFGVEEIPGRKLDAGETVATEDTILFAPAPKEDPGPAFPLDATDVFDAGYPTPLGGPTFSLGVLATPNAEIAGESVNPLARTSSEELLTGDLARGVLADAGLTDADRVDWLVGPVSGQVAWLPVDSVTVLGEEAGLETYGGVVSGKAGPWAVSVHLAKATPDDVVVPAALHRRPVGTPDGRALFGDGSGFVDQQWTTRGLEFTGQVVASLRSGEA